MEGSLVPITNEQATAIAEVAKLGGSAVELVKGAGGYLARVLGTVPEDIVGILGGDALRIRRIENAARLSREAKERLEARQVQSEPPPLALLGPILNPGSEEEREELRTLWAALLAAAMDPSRASDIRHAHINTLKAMDPPDALILQAMRANPPPTMQPTPMDFLRNVTPLGRDAAEISILHLIDLGVLRDLHVRPGEVVVTPQRVDYTAFGRELAQLLLG